MINKISAVPSFGSTYLQVDSNDQRCLSDRNIAYSYAHNALSTHVAPYIAVGSYDVFYDRNSGIVKVVGKDNETDKKIYEKLLQFHSDKIISFVDDVKDVFAIPFSRIRETGGLSDVEESHRSSIERIRQEVEEDIQAREAEEQRRRLEEDAINIDNDNVIISTVLLDDQLQQEEFDLLTNPSEYNPIFEEASGFGGFSDGLDDFGGMDDGFGF